MNRPLPTHFTVSVYPPSIEAVRVRAEQVQAIRERDILTRPDVQEAFDVALAEVSTLVQESRPARRPHGAH